MHHCLKYLIVCCALLFPLVTYCVEDPVLKGASFVKSYDPNQGLSISHLLSEHEVSLRGMESDLPERRKAMLAYLELKNNAFNQYYVRMNKSDLWMYAKSWRFPILLSFFCMEIDNLYDEYQQECRQYEVFKNEQVAEVKEFLLFASKLRDLDTRYLLDVDREKLQDVLQKSAKFEVMCNNFSTFMDSEYELFCSLDSEMKDLKADAGELRTNMMERIFFKPEAPLIDVLNGTSFIYNSLKDDLRFFLSIQHKLLVSLWLPILFLLVFLLPICCWIGGSVYKKLVKHFQIVDGKLKSRYFSLGFGIVLMSLFVQSLRFKMPIDMILIFEMMRHFMAIGFFILAVSIRCSAAEIGIVLRLYLPMMLYYITIGALWLGMVNYAMMIFISPVLNLIFVIWSLAIIIYYRKRLPGLDIGLIWVSLLIACFGLWLSYMGYVYSSFAIIVFLFVLLLGWQLAKAAAVLINSHMQRHPNTQIINCILETLILPLMTIGVLFFGINWTADMFNVTQALMGMFDKDLMHFTNSVQFSLRDIFHIFIAGIAIRFFLLLIRRIVEITYQEAAQFGLIPTLLTLLNYFTWAVFVIYALLVLNVNYQSMLVVLGGMSMGIGFGLKDVVDNFACGVGLLVGQQLRPGDEIECDGVRGKIKAIGFRLTVLESADGAVVCFQNADILRKNFKNMTSNHGYERVDVIVGIAYGTDIEKARYAMLEAIKECRCVISHPIPEILVWDFDASSVNLSARVWVPVAFKTTSASTVREKIYEMFKKHCIEIPFPQLDVHMIPPKEETPTSLSEPNASDHSTTIDYQ